MELPNYFQLKFYIYLTKNQGENLNSYKNDYTNTLFLVGEFCKIVNYVLP